MPPTDTSAKLRPKARPINYPALVRLVCAKQPRVSLEEMQRSVLEGINSARLQQNPPRRHRAICF